MKKHSTFSLDATIRPVSSFGFSVFEQNSPLAPDTLPEPATIPETEPRPALPERIPDLDPFSPAWPKDRPEPQPKA